MGCCFQEVELSWVRSHSSYNLEIVLKLRTWLLGDGDYYNNTKLFLKWASDDFNDNAQNHFPIFGVCMGFEVLAYIFNDEQECRTETDDTYGVSLALNFTLQAENSTLFSGTPQWMMDYLGRVPITANFHRYSVLSQEFNSSLYLPSALKVLSTNVDSSGMERIVFGKKIFCCFILWLFCFNRESFRVFC